jgi:hypothetical protein
MQRLLVLVRRWLVEDHVLHGPGEHIRRAWSATREPRRLAAGDGVTARAPTLSLSETPGRHANCRAGDLASPGLGELSRGPGQVRLRLVPGFTAPPLQSCDLRAPAELGDVGYISGMEQPGHVRGSRQRSDRPLSGRTYPQLLHNVANVHGCWRPVMLAVGCRGCCHRAVSRPSRPEGRRWQWLSRRR